MWPSIGCTMHSQGWPDQQLGSGPSASLSWALGQTLEREGTAQLTVYGGSMLPILWPGSKVRLRPVDRSPRVGECVLATGPRDDLVLHRVVSVSANWVVLRGDAQRTTERFPMNRVIAIQDGSNLGPLWIPTRLPAWFVSIARAMFLDRKNRGGVGALGALLYARGRRT